MLSEGNSVTTVTVRDENRTALQSGNELCLGLVGIFSVIPLTRRCVPCVREDRYEHTVSARLF